jgi:hypothetical protein
MSEPLKDFLSRTGRDLLKPSGTVAVLVQMTARSVSPVRLNELRALGLSVTEVVNDVVMGTIDASQVEQLRSGPGVREVEISTKLRPH